MTTCRFMVEVGRWAELGNQHSLPSDLHSHAARCEVCAQFIRSVELARELGQQLPATAMGQERHDSVKFRLMAAARQSASLPRASERRVRLNVRLLVAACVVTAAAAAGTYVVKYVRVSRLPEESGEPVVASSLSHLDDRGMSATLDKRVAAAASPIPRSSPSVVTLAGTNPAGAVPANVASAAVNPDGDASFTEAWAALRSKRPAEAAKHFDALLNSSSLDAARRADVLYWSAQSHRQAGNASAALSRSSQLLRLYPSAPFASDAALILGEYALANHQFDAAARYLNQAATSERPVVRERARRALRELVKKDAH